MSYLDTLNEKRQSKLAATMSQSERDELLSTLKDNQLATLISNTKPTVILTDQTDLGDKISELTTKMVASIEKLDVSEVNNDQLVAIDSAVSALKSVEAILIDYTTTLETQTDRVVEALNNIELSPNITVPKPQVTIHEKPISFAPLEEAIESLRVEKPLSLADYRAHDIDTAPDGLQYIGYISLDGSWYIIQSNDAANTMRYYFGKGDYANGWADKYSHDYTTLSEAVHALSA
jgi:hypothetical protein